MNLLKPMMLFSFGAIAGWSVQYYVGSSHHDIQDREQRKLAAVAARADSDEMYAKLPDDGLLEFSEGDQIKIVLMMDALVDATMAEMLDIQCLGYRNPMHKYGLHDRGKDPLDRHPSLSEPITGSPQ